ncbi:39S ribosomal protein L52, mitochondrial [Ceratina calcarata]|uniref:Large ribosomal subunit protein mL52 n=1 Tax=Ceratina calcarata TaxID=156304 RepID=A0AAJ7J4W5_9HYME|nr:39S ribosomal protein L52, mitochondrial [Ceratina calcarata]
MNKMSFTAIFRAANSRNLAVCANKFHTSVICLDLRWRMKKGLAINPNAEGPLLNLPDYSFKDKEKPVPYRARQLGRIQKHQNYMRRIAQLVGEVDHAVEKHARLLKEEEERRQQILDSKLKPKGQKLISSE